MTRALAVVLAALLAACSSGSAPAPGTTTTTTTSAPASTSTSAPTTTTTTTTAPLRTVAVTGVSDVPAEFRSVVAAAWSAAADDRNPRSGAPGELIDYLAAGDLAESIRLTSFASAQLADGSSVAVARSSDGALLLAADEGSGWELAGARLDGTAPWYGASPHMVLILGSDARPGQDPLRFHADSIHVVTALPEEGTGAILGWPRDSFVPTPYGDMKITALMVNRGPAVMRDQFRDYWDLPVSGYIVTGFRGFERLVGELGRIFIDIPRSLPTQEWFAGFSNGEQWLNPVRALDYARTRKGVPGGDLTRSRNQGVLMLAALRMVQMSEMEDLPGMLAALTAHTDTDLSASRLIQLAASAMELDPEAVVNEVLPGTVGRAANNASVVFLDPTADDLVADLRDDGLLTDG